MVGLVLAQNQQDVFGVNEAVNDLQSFAAFLSLLFVTLYCYGLLSTRPTFSELCSVFCHCQSVLLPWQFL